MKSDQDDQEKMPLQGNGLHPGTAAGTVAKDRTPSTDTPNGVHTTTAPVKDGEIGDDVGKQ